MDKTIKAVSNNGVYAKIMLWVTSGVLTASLAMNAFFLVSVMNKIDTLVTQTNTNTNDIGKMKEKVDNHENFIENLVKPHVYSDDTYVKPKKLLTE